MALADPIAVISQATAFVITSDRVVIDEWFNVPDHQSFVTFSVKHLRSFSLDRFTTLN